MCGIVGLHLKNPGLAPRLGGLLTEMLEAMTTRGPDSAGTPSTPTTRRPSRASSGDKARFDPNGPGITPAPRPSAEGC